MFSVVIPYYKKRSYIERCIDSALAQTYTDYEIIVVDDGSQDDLKELIERKYSGKVHLIQQENQGVSAARNTGIAAATHDYIAFLDADDCWSPFYLEFSNICLEKEDNVKIIGSNFTRIIKDIPLIRPNLNYLIIKNYFKEQVFKDTLFTSSSTIINYAFFRENIGFNSQLKRGEDLDVWFRAIASGGKVVYIENTLVYYSNEDLNQVTNSSFDFQYSILSIMRNEYLKKGSPNVFKEFVPIFIRKRIYSYYFDKRSHEKAREELKSIGYGNFFSKVFYHLPVSLGRNVSKTKLFRYYSKFLIK